MLMLEVRCSGLAAREHLCSLAVVAEAAAGAVVAVQPEPAVAAVVAVPPAVAVAVAVVVAAAAVATVDSYYPQLVPN